MTTFAELVADWSAVVGPQIARIAQPAALDCLGVLHLRVLTDAWRAELEGVGPDLVALLPSVDGVAVRRVRFHCPPDREPRRRVLPRVVTR
jgi:hypothetical protein